MKHSIYSNYLAEGRHSTVSSKNLSQVGSNGFPAVSQPFFHQAYGAPTYFEKRLAWWLFDLNRIEQDRMVQKPIPLLNPSNKISQVKLKIMKPLTIAGSAFTLWKASYLRKVSKIVILIGLFVQMANADEALAQTSDDVKAIVKLCIDHQPLESFFPKDAFGKSKQLVVQLHGIDMEGIALSKFDKPVLFLDKKAMGSHLPEAFFLFHNIRMEGDNAWVDFLYDYVPSSMESGKVLVELQLRRDTGNWEIFNSKMEER